MDTSHAIDAVRTVAVSAESVPLELYRAHYTGSPGGFGPFCWAVNREIAARYGIELRKKGNVFVPTTAVQHLRRGDKHGIKSMRQRRYQVETYDALVKRTDASEELKIRALSKRDRAAATLADMNTKQRQRERLRKLLEGQPSKGGP